MNKIKKCSILVGILCVVSIVGLGFAPYANAALTTAVALDKFESYGLYRCMNNRFKREFSAEEIKDYNTIDKLLDPNKVELEGGGWLGGGDLGKTDNNYVALPAGQNLRESDDDQISCIHLIWNLLDVSNDENPYGSFSSLLEKFGYVKQDGESGSSARCKLYNFQYPVNSAYQDAGAIKYCESAVNEQGEIMSGSSPTFEYVGFNDSNSADGFIWRGEIKLDGNTLTYFLADTPGLDIDDIDDYRVAKGVERSGKWEDVTKKLGDAIGEMFRNNGGRITTGPGGSGIPLEYGNMTDGKSEAVDGLNSYKMGKSFDAFKRAYKNIFGADFTDYSFNKSQTAGFYQSYLLSYYSADMDACDDTKDGSTEKASNLVIYTGGTYNGDYVQTKIYDNDGVAQYCYVKTSRYGDMVYGISSNKPVTDLNKKISFSDIAKWLLDNGPDKVDPNDLVAARNGDDDNPDDNDIEQTCKDAAGSEALGWILCPLLKWVSNAAEGVYKDHVEPNLQMKPELFTGDGGSSVHAAWETFRDIANIGFIILFLVVIFSQLTGVGIDNYGIKKILPKIIVAAVLINLSYLICEILIDLSNIMGNGLQSLFKGLGSGLESSLNNIPFLKDAKEGEAGGFDPSTLIAGLGIFAVAAAAVGAIWANPGILISLLVTGIGIMVAIFFLFVLLGARKAGIIVLTAISPLAVVTYMLPNTKKLYDRWWKFFSGLLLVYPIAGLLVGAGDYVSRLLLVTADGSFGMWLTAMVVGVAPIFFIPKVLKSSFAAMGKVGATIAGLGTMARGRATKAMRGTDVYKNTQERGLERRTRIKAGVNRKGKSTALSRKVGRVMNLGSGKNMARNRSQYLKNQDARTREKSLMGVGYDAAIIAQEKKAEADEASNYMTLVNNRTRNGENQDELYNLYDEYMKEGNKAGAIAVARIAGRRKDTAEDFMRKKIIGMDEDGTIHDVAAGQDRKVLASVMKEISTGENSSTYRQSAPLGFEFAAQFNRDYREDNGVPVDGAGEARYSNWRNTPNVDAALSHYVTDGQQLVGVKGKALREIATLMNTSPEEGGMSDSEKARIQTLADSVIENRDKPGAVWDSTKAKELAALSSKYQYNPDTKAIELRPGATAGVADAGRAGSADTGTDSSGNGASTGASTSSATNTSVTTSAGVGFGMGSNNSKNDNTGSQSGNGHVVSATVGASTSVLRNNVDEAGGKSTNDNVLNVPHESNSLGQSQKHSGGSEEPVKGADVNGGSAPNNTNDSGIRQSIVSGGKDSSFLDAKKNSNTGMRLKTTIPEDGKKGLVSGYTINDHRAGSKHN